MVAIACVVGLCICIASAQHPAVAAKSNDLIVRPFQHKAISADARFGAEIYGLQSVDALSDIELDVIKSALLEYKVISFPDSGQLFTPQGQLDLALRLGRVELDSTGDAANLKLGVHRALSVMGADVAAAANADDSVASIVNANKPENKMYHGVLMPSRVARVATEAKPGTVGFGEGLHADVTFAEEPPFYTFVIQREGPLKDDDTCFVDMTRAYELLSTDLRHRVTGMSALHNDLGNLSAVHPIVRTHPEKVQGGTQTLYVNPHFTKEVLGLPGKEGDALLGKLFEHIEAQQQFCFKWTGHHAVIWDNRQVLHAAHAEWAREPSSAGKRRELHRVMIRGPRGLFSRPFYKPSARALASSSSRGDEL